MVGIVLCGGQSSRMGSDKGLLKSGGQCWAERAAEKLSALAIPVKISINRMQLGSYKKIFPAIDLITDNEALFVKGPLLGLLSCHLACPSEDLFVLACDLPNLKSSYLESLYDVYRTQPASAYLFRNNGSAEPLCGIYTSHGLAQIFSYIKAGVITRHSMKHMLEHLNVHYIDLKKSEMEFLANANTPSDLNDH